MTEDGPYSDCGQGSLRSRDWFVKISRTRLSWGRNGRSRSCSTPITSSALGHVRQSPRHT